jgi:hypothetical protein
MLPTRLDLSGVRAGPGSNSGLRGILGRMGHALSSMRDPRARDDYLRLKLGKTARPVRDRECRLAWAISARLGSAPGACCADAIPIRPEVCAEARGIGKF